MHIAFYQLTTPHLQDRVWTYTLMLTKLAVVVCSSWPLSLWPWRPMPWRCWRREIWPCAGESLFCSLCLPKVHPSVFICLASVCINNNKRTNWFLLQRHSDRARCLVTRVSVHQRIVLHRSVSVYIPLFFPAFHQVWLEMIFFSSCSWCSHWQAWLWLVFHWEAWLWLVFHWEAWLWLVFHWEAWLWLVFYWEAWLWLVFHNCHIAMLNTLTIIVTVVVFTVMICTRNFFSFFAGMDRVAVHESQCLSLITCVDASVICTRTDTHTHLHRHTHAHTHLHIHTHTHTLAHAHTHTHTHLHTLIDVHIHTLTQTLGYWFTE